MMLPFPTMLVDNPELIKAEQLNLEGAMALKTLADKGYEVCSGLNIEYADIITGLCRQPAIREYCPNDIATRFANRQATVKWLAGGRAVYLLLPIGASDSTQLAGYGWLGAKQNSRVPGGQVTFALRISPDHQGKGLATPFSQAMLADAQSVYHVSHVWLETWQSNAGAVHVYHKLGFKDVSKKADRRPSLSGEEVEDVRIYMMPDKD